MCQSWALGGQSEVDVLPEEKKKSFVFITVTFNAVAHIFSNVAYFWRLPVLGGKDNLLQKL